MAGTGKTVSGPGERHAGDARQQFMSSCLSNKPVAETKKPQCVNGKPRGNSCIAKDKICHK
jgi:hypothetical protein